jgi:hypothetical protein
MAYKQKKWTAFTKTNKKLKKAEKEMQRQKDVYAGLDTSNPYENMENVYEDMTINQKGYDAKIQQAQQSQANLIDSMKESYDGSGAASLVQAISTENQKAIQTASADIGKQEKENQTKEREFEAKIQDKKRQGEIWSRNAERDKKDTLMGISQQEVAAQKEIASEANKAKWDAIQGGVQNVSNTLSS